MTALGMKKKTRCHNNRRAATTETLQQLSMLTILMTGVGVGGGVGALVGAHVTLYLVFFFDYLGACRRRTPRARVALKAAKAALRFETGPSGRSPSACAETSLKIKNKIELYREAFSGAMPWSTSACFGNFSGHADGERRGLDPIGG